MPIEELEKKTLNIRKGDWDFLTDIYQPRGLSTSEVVRKIISLHVEHIRSKQTPITELLHE